ncbi:MAG: hypothetical protein IT214_03430 [Chitinophagaceae bacterium]|jgi:hypothetical protein|nr:hypothetical protein [Chitinophagaceae bacterium]OQY96927.1 MAG: hypothetical protein B6D37_00060 [Sphingobacteriales bacterium UTBCD1]
MKSLFSKKSIALITIPALLLSFTFLAAKTNFSGNWKLNEGKSDFGQRGARFATKELKVDQKDNSISITKTTPSFQGGEDMTTSETYTFDGKEVEGKGFGNSTKKSSLKWAGDEQSFTISSTTSMERNGESMEFHSTESWSLGDGGKTLTVTTTSTSPRGENTTKAVYDKQ